MQYQFIVDGLMLLMEKYLTNIEFYFMNIMKTQLIIFLLKLKN